MEMWAITIKNNSGGAVVIEDLGITLPDATTENFGESFSFEEIAGSDDLRAFVLAGTLVVNDGVGDLSAADGVNRLTIHNKEEVLKDHYTKTELSNDTGGVDVHWNNIINAPSFGAPNWLAPVLYRVLDITGTAPGSPAVNDVYVDTGTNPDKYFKWNGVSWVDVGDAADGDRVINLADAQENIYEYDSGGDSWTELAANADNDAVVVDDDGDTKAAQYTYDLTGTTWVKIADVDFGGHLDGGANKHDASEIDVEGTYTNISGTPTDLESTISAIDTALGAISGNTLDAAYDEGGAGAGRTITADSGAVVIDRAAATNAALELVPKAAAPTTGLNGGQFHVDSATGLVYVYDATRSKWLSIQRLLVSFGRKGQTRDQYLNFFGGELTSNNAGLRLIRDCTLVGASMQFNTSGTGSIEVRRNDTATAVHTHTVTAALGSQDGAVDVDFAAGDSIQGYLESTVKVDDPMATLEFAYRL